ncbi:tyrosine-type recombinase/integrase [Bacterioplanoides pacificum]|uniref:Tyrosine-type recombinase/integrase n=1 Tax=Bacterioplanoides pacificum TaxID=1171596 RepID=A0ABV7VQ27_9GAMM
MDQAISLGLCKDNLAEMALAPVYKVRRQRMNKETFQWLLENSDAWVRCALLLVVVTLQRLSDLVSIRKDDIRNGRLYVIQKKTKKYDAAYIAIEITPGLQEVIDACLALPYPGSYLLRKKPTPLNWRGQRVQNRTERTQVIGKTLSTKVTRLINRCPHVQYLTPAERPSFHELRAYGIKLYQDHKLNSQPLAGHSSERQHKNYDSRHEDIRWVEIDASLPLDAVVGSETSS